MPLLTRNIVFVHIPKTGGQSIESLYIMNRRKLYGVLGNYELAHLTAYQIKSILGPTVKMFTIIRNPVDRMISEYRYRKMGDNRFLGKCDSFAEFSASLEERFDEILTRPHKETCHFIPQYMFIDSGTKIFRFGEWDKIASFLRVKKIPHVNKSPVIVEDYDTTIIEKLYEEDMKLWTSND